MEQIKTGRLCLRRFAATDLPDLHEYLSDPEVVKYEPYPLLGQEECREFLERMAASEDFWAVCLLDGGKVIGQVYLAAREWEAAELGYVFNRHYQRQGYAREAVQALLAHTFERAGTHRVYANCNPANSSSWRLLAKLGFRREGHLKQNIYFSTDDAGRPLWQDTYEYALLAAEWHERQSRPYTTLQ